MQLRSKRSTGGFGKVAKNDGFSNIGVANSVLNGVQNGPAKQLHQNGHLPGSSSSGEKQPSYAYTVFYYTFLPFCMLTLIPNLSMVLWYTAVKCDGSYEAFFEKLFAGGVVGFLMQIWRDSFTGLTAVVWLILLGYFLFAVMLQMLVPGPRHEGPVTPKGNIPVYKDNGFRCYLISLITFAGLTWYLKQHGLSPTIVYDKFDSFLLATNISGHVLCTFLLIKGLTRPTTTDSGSSGNFIFDYYWGTDLYPKVLGVDVKVFTNCRFGMTIWALLIMIYVMKNYELYGFVDSSWVSCALQMIYITKFFWWEAGYYNSIDIIVDRAGYMICWGCLSYIPGMYAAASMYLVNHPVKLGPVLSILILIAGALAITVNYWADYQRQITRHTNGQTTIWGRQPALIHAKYQLDAGNEKHSILLVSGFWAVARHFNYIPEIMLSFFWCLPALFENVMPYSYVIYLIILLVHRSYRDDRKCLKKYGKYWEEYCKLVPYKMIPGIL